MFLEGLCVCVNYSDFLNETLRTNKGLFDTFRVVTTAQDTATRETCRKHCVETILTDDFTRDGPNEFAKARGINRGLEMMAADGWRLHLDADIVLPPIFRQLLEMAHLDPECIYGCDRVMLHSWEEWQAFQSSGHLAHDYGCRVSPPPYTLGTRWVSPHYGWVPCGFFQLAHSSAYEWRGVHHRRYPERHGDAARCDIQHGLQWDRRKRVLLPELFVVHLESQQAPKGANWAGRTTIPFGPHKQGQQVVSHQS